jgi:mono/diheme cytochrome c family protein
MTAERLADSTRSESALSWSGASLQGPTGSTMHIRYKRIAPWLMLAAALAIGIGAVAAVAIAESQRGDRASAAVDSGNAAQLAQGEALYARQCAACHGTRLEGQPNWQTVGPDGKVLAPPLDATGHGWQHTDDELFRLVKFSVTDVAPAGYVSDMPEFADTLSDDQVRAVLAFIQSRWPRDFRAYQAMMTNPTAAQAASLGDDWRYPPLCEEPSRALAAARQQAAHQGAPAPAAK